jgi:hypothetical protein
VVVRKVVVLTTIVLFYLTVGVFADVSWDNGSGDNLWSTASNWNPDGLPTTSVNVDITTLTTGPIINSPTIAGGLDIRVGGSSNANLTMNSGTLNAGEWMMVGTDQAASQPGTFTMNGGTINLGYTTSVNGHLWIGYKYTGTFTMNGGTINAPGRFGLSWSGGTANAYLYGGTITAGYFSMTSASRIDITNGTLIVTGNVKSIIDGYVSSGWITAFNGAGTVSVDYNITNSGKTTVKASYNPQKAKSPGPANNASNVLLSTALSWTAGAGVSSHNVYFGTSNPPDFKNNQTTTTFNPGTLDFDTVYYWRIDEVAGANTITGDLWTFTTTTGLAQDPNPGNGALNVGFNPVLHWTAGPGAVSHDVYFGTNIRDARDTERIVGDLDGNRKVDYGDLQILINHWLENPAGSQPYAGVNDDNIVNFIDYFLLANNWMQSSSQWFKGNINTTTYMPGSLAASKTYYWRVDEVNGPDIKTGDVWSFTTAATDSNYSLVGKIMCGYQGWFDTPTDGANRGWVHWGNSGFSPTNCTVDMWPDTNEMSPSEKYLASSFYDGNNYYVFSSHNRNTVLRHFSWMQQYGIDGVYLQRFGTEITPGSLEFNHRNAVLSYCKDGANLYGRKYAVMYDLTGIPLGGTANIINDWKYLVDTVRVGRDPCDQGYIRYKNKPVVAVWGIGWTQNTTDRQYSWAECLNLVNFLKDDPTYGGNIVMIGVKDNWKSKTDSNATMLAICTKADIISPWTVGGYASGGVNNYANSKWWPDKQWCTSHGKDYLPVIWPGYSFWNASGHSTAPLNKYPRYGGQFLWDQVNAAISIAATNMLYVAMFDEVDEGTAIFKVSNNPPRPGGVDMFVTYNMDGFTLPSDEYLWLVGQAGKGLRGEIPVNQARPAR